MKKTYTFLTILVFFFASCVSKKNYVELEEKLNDTRANLQKTTIEKKKIEEKLSNSEKKVISTKQEYTKLSNLHASLKEESDLKMTFENEAFVISNSMKREIRENLKKVNTTALANAKNLKDSLNVAISYNLNKALAKSDLGETSKDININIDKTVVMISISDKLLFNSGSYMVNIRANDLLKKIADILIAEPNIDLMVEGHTDSRTISNIAVQDNWDLSVRRATSIVRILEKKYKIDPKRLIAAGRGSAVPLVPNDTEENRAKNRRTRIVILPNLDRFFQMLDADQKETPIKE